MVDGFYCSNGEVQTLEEVKALVTRILKLSLCSKVFHGTARAGFTQNVEAVYQMIKDEI